MLSGQVETQREWVTPTVDAAIEAAIEPIMAATGCPRAIALLLTARGIAKEAQARAFFSPTLGDLIDPLCMLGMATAVERIQRAVRDSEPILIYGDYDVDGTTATVLLKTAIERSAPKGAPALVRYHVPHRLREGYGMRSNVLAEAVASGVRLVISVDTGIRAFAAATESRALGLDLIVTDHHLPDAQGVPEAVAVVNPAQSGCGYPFKSLCGAAVAFKLAHAILRAACVSEIERERLERTLVPSFLKLVAIATIADSVPLEGENRVIAALGLRELRNPVHPGLRALMEVAEIPTDRPPTATEVGFRIAPRINAAGRMDVASDVVELFLTRDPERARELAAKLNRLNEERKATEARALEAIDDRLAALRGDGDQLPALCLVLDDADWHRGVLGILASRIVDRTGRPALVLTHEEGEAHGSGRSIHGYHLLDALASAHDEDGALFNRFGGHAHAVGFSLPSVNVDLLRSRMERHSATWLATELLAPPLACDIEIDLEDLAPEFYKWLERCGPFGTGHPEPLLVSRGVTLAADVRIIKERHIALELHYRSARLTALGWSRAGTLWTELCRQLALAAGSRIDVAYRLRSKHTPWYTGLELELVDLRLSV